VFPNADHVPPAGRQAAIGVAIASLVGFDLLAPIRSVRGWPGGVFWAPVPETSIDEHGDPRRTEDDVRSPASILENRTVHSKPQAATMKQAP